MRRKCRRSFLAECASVLVWPAHWSLNREILLADEPRSGLDRITAAEIIAGHPRREVPLLSLGPQHSDFSLGGNANLPAILLPLAA